ncbi:hypothetical protein D3C76_1117320 [compost metagenome]
MIVDHRRGVAADAERRIHHIGVAQQAEACAAGDLIAGVGGRQAGIASAGGIDADRRQGHLAQHQGVTAIVTRNHLHAAVGQQARECLRCGVGAGKSRADQAFGDRRLERQGNAGGQRKARQGGAERPGGYVIGSGGDGFQLHRHGGQGERSDERVQGKAQQHTANDGLGRTIRTQGPRNEHGWMTLWTR